MGWFCVLMVCVFPGLFVEEVNFVYLLSKLVWWRVNGGGTGGFVFATFCYMCMIAKNLSFSFLTYLYIYLFNLFAYVSRFN